MARRTTQRDTVIKRDTVIIGGGQAGLAMSYLLTEQGRDHVILEKGRRLGESWRGRWDSFTLVTPNWQLQLPGRPYQGDAPDGFLERDEVVAYLEQYAASFDPPLRFDVAVHALHALDDGEGWLLETTDGDYTAANVVVATGTFQSPNIPSFSRDVPPAVEQVHSSQYQNPQRLPDGAVLVVGSGQSGCQIAQELHESGRQVYLSTSKVGRLPRRYRGRDSFWWADRLGFFDETVTDLDSPAARFAPNPQASGRDGGQEINLHLFARHGIVLLGHMEGIEGQQAIFAPDLQENLGAGDKVAQQFCRGVDKYVEKAGLEVPEEMAEMPQDGYEQPEILQLDLAEAGISTIIWATGFQWDFSWIRLPILDEWGYPRQEQGVTTYLGLYFLGLHWLHTRKSGLFFGIGEDARHVAEHLQERAPAAVSAHG